MTEKNEKPSIEQQVAEWSAERAEIATLVATAEGVTVAGHADGPKAGREKVHDTLMPIWRRRCAIDNREKELLEIPKQITKRIKDVAAELSAPLLAVENRLRADRDAYDAEQARIAQEAADTKRHIAEERRAVMGKYCIVPALSLVDGATPEEWSAKPSLDKAHAWLDAVLAAVAAVPPVEDASVRRDLARCAELLRGVIAEERGNFAPF